MNNMQVHPVEQDLPSPLAGAAPNLSESELRETAYEIIVWACRSSMPKPLKFISQSNKEDGNAVQSVVPGSSQRTGSKVKNVMGPKTMSIRRTGTTKGELMRVQMRVSELTDTRIRRALLRVSASQLGGQVESMVLPLELIQQLRRSDFTNQQEYEAWLRRNLKVLEAGLLLHPRLPLDEADANALQLQRIISANLEKPMDIGNKNTESLQALRVAVTSLASRSSDGSVPETTCHWADGFPLNLKIYQTLLKACFDNHEETCVIEEVDEVLELIKKTWVVLGLNEMLHNICFSWVLFRRYVATGQVKSDLLLASSNLLAEAEKERDGDAMKDSCCSKSLNSSMLCLILSWAEKRLLAYHDTFHDGNIETMQIVVSLAVSSAKILAEDVSRTRVENYIRSSLFSVFAQKLEKLDPSKLVSRKQNTAFLDLSALARDIRELAFHEKLIYSPILKRWHPLAAGVAVATLHVCYGNELKQYVRSITELSHDDVEVLLAADKLEKDLVHIAVEDSIDSEDGGISIIREMHPYGAEAIISNLAKSWVQTKVEILEEWVDTNLQQEEWNPHADKEFYASSAVEVLRIIDDTVEAFFLLPIPMHAVLLPELICGLDNTLQQYIFKAKSGCGNRKTFIPTMPALTRCSTGSKFHGVFKKKEKSSQATHRRSSQVGSTNKDSSFGLLQLCVRINTMQHICMELKVLEKRTMTRLGSSKATTEHDGLKFKLSAAASVEGVDQLSEAIAYKVVFRDLRHVLWDGLYVGEVSSTRIDPFLEKLEQSLEIISSTVQDRARILVITEVIKAALEGFLLVLLSGGPSRVFSLEDSAMIEDDFKFMADFFWSNRDGYGLSAESIQELSATVKGVLPLFSMDTENLIHQLSKLSMEKCGSSGRSRFSPLSSASVQWNPGEPNTLLRVLCHRKDETAAKFLKKNYNLPTKI